MSSESTPTDIDLSPRDVTILKARVKYPTASVRELRDTLEEEYDISLSHNRINDILREVKSEGLFRILAAPDKDLFEYFLFRISFHYPTFEERWDDCHAELVRDPHVLLFFSTDDYHQWQCITQFRSLSDSEEWKEDFFKKHEDVIAGFDKTRLTDMYKFSIDSTIFDDVLRQMDGGEKYMDSNL